jgi:hypothetical protein
MFGVLVDESVQVFLWRNKVSCASGVARERGMKESGNKRE